MNLKINDVTFEKLKKIASSNNEVYVYLEKGTHIYRAQDKKHSNPIYFSLNNGRYSDSLQKYPVFYGALTPATSIAEHLQISNSVGGEENSSFLRIGILEKKALFELEANRNLCLVDASALVRLLGGSLSDIVQKRGDESEGYDFTQTLCSAVLRAGLEIDGMVYPSSADPRTLGDDGVCIVFFHENDGKLVQKVRGIPLMEYSLPDGRTVMKLLEDRHAVVL